MRLINADELIKRLDQAGLDDAVKIAVKMAGHERVKHNLHELLQTAVDRGIITETQAARLMDVAKNDNYVAENEHFRKRT